MQRAEQALANKRNPRLNQMNRVEPVIAGSLRAKQVPASTSLKVTPSVVNLTKPELYGIYGGSSNLVDSDEEDETENIYNNLSEGLVRSTSHHLEESKIKYEQEQTTTHFMVVTFSKAFTCVLLLSVAGNLMFFFAEQLYESNPVLPDISKYRILYFFQDVLSQYSSKDEFHVQLLGNSIESNILGFATYTLSKLISALAPNWVLDLDRHRKKKIQEPANDAAQPQESKDEDDETSNEKTSSLSQQAQQFITVVFDSNVVRSMVSAVGLAYCFKKYQWSSKLQVASLWVVANLLIWSGLDSTIVGLITSALIAVSSVVLDCYFSGLELSLSDHDTLADLLWIASFVFIGQIILGKIIKLVYA
ncbi:DEKNAAC102756 [Brettanomyces naardenensis]|uniref:DEKNAAC102756 n=1 Tax=Brettanomyces naardenensis TaxID=13370 RepID=A0A448YKS0_BRENA|nr:DEKNAAC102756 [Brettanomyces naardenensis]